MKIAIACDHAGFEYKNLVIEHLKAQHSITDFGTKSLDSVDYPDFIHPCADAVEQQVADLGIIICGSGNGAQITANKHQGIRAALCWNTELAALARQHNDANIISIPSRFVSEETALAMVDTFLSTAFEGGRHQDRVNKIKCC